MEIIAENRSPETIVYNCIAWAANDSLNFWWPSIFPRYYWPQGVRREETVDAFVDAYATRGFQICKNTKAEKGWEKIAIYADHLNKPKHAARQIDEKIWTSKLGRSYDIYHPLVKKWNTINLDGVKIDLSHYGNLAKLLKRKI